MTSPGHEMILASAGSGKTYALTNRFVQLLALGAKPERIVALTFTRKAAGEFFDEILNKLARAATDEAFATKLARDIGAPAVRMADFLVLLRSVVDAMPRLALGTFDSFFSRIVRMFPLELGLGGDFDVLQEHSAHIERRRVLRRMFARNGPTLDESQRGFIESFKRATFGVDEKNLASSLDAFLDAHTEIFLAAPDADLWGNEHRIWPAGLLWAGAPSPADAAASVRRTLAARGDLNDAQRQRLEDFFTAFESWSPAAPLLDAATYLIKNAANVWNELLTQSAILTLERKKVSLSPAECDALRDLVASVVAAEITRRLEITRGIHAVLAGYDSVYHDTVRRAGKLTFADIQRLLSPDAGAPTLATDRDDTDASERRLLLDWRLDGQFDHWLLDEFQDTSRGQWSVLKNLIDEVIQDASHARTFFYVGDVKQAIYAWREGDSRLFREIFNHYNVSGSGIITERRLDTSWRSGPAVLALVNRVFGDAPALADLFAEAGKRWSLEWRDHASANSQLGGHAAWIHASEKGERFASTLQVLQEIRPLERGLTTAILVQKNDTAAELAEFLRREGGLAAIAESDLHVCTDNPLTSALLALFKAAAHPGDSLAREHVHMTPLQSALDSAGAGARDTTTTRLLHDVHTRGFEWTVEVWLRRLEPHLSPDDRFSRERGRQMAKAARLYDESGGRDVAEFIQFMERHTVRDTESASVVRVMTIHKAKGLGFDLVILPDLEGDRLAQRREGLAVQKAADRSIEWILDLPPKLIAERDATLKAHVASAEAEGCYEKLALLYVAMTRAKRATYVIAKPAAPTSSSNNFSKLLTTTLGDTANEIAIGALRVPGSFSEGDANWFSSLNETAPAPAASEVISTMDMTSARRVVRLPAQTPSDTKSGILSGAALFASSGDDATAFGRAVHAALATVEWWAPENRVAWLAAQKARGTSDDVVTEVESCLAARSLARVFARTENAATEVWRERAFEIVIDGTWVTGIFDRVLVVRDTAGRATRAVVFDFKTDRPAGNRVSPDWSARIAQRYASQMTLYCRAAAVLTGLPRESIDAALVLTASVSLVPMGKP